MKMRSDRIALDKIYKRRDRYEIPDWQREAVWNPDKSALLVDSVLRGWKLPKFYFILTSEKPDMYEVVDGQQRLGAIWSFFDGDLTLGPKDAAFHGGSTYDALPDATSDAFDDFEIECDIITDYEDDEIREFFQRLQSGLPLNSSERLNAIKSGLRDYAAELSEHAFFKSKCTVPIKRYSLFDICAKVLAIELEGLDAGLRFDDMSRTFNGYKSYSSESASAKRVKGALDWLDEEFEGPQSSLRSRAVVQSLISMTSHLIESGMPKSGVKKLRSFFDEFYVELTKQVELGQDATQPDLIVFQSTVNANTRAGARIRHTLLLSRLLRHSPALFPLSQFRPGLKVRFEEISRRTQSGYVTRSRG